MILKSDISAKHNSKIGSVFTPSEWANFAIEKFGIFDLWIKGKSVFDPTMGDGQLLASLIEYGINQGYKAEELPTHLLFGNELNNENYSNALKRFVDAYNLDMSKQFSNQDFFECTHQQHDVIFGNPPWQNYVDLPDNYKGYIRTKFELYGFTKDKRRLLLGSSRMDLATLIIQAAMADFWKNNGVAFFFLPLSIFLNDGANEVFRNYTCEGKNFALKTIYDFGDTSIFKGISTRNGLVSFKNNEATNYPIPYQSLNKGSWILKLANPLFSLQSPLSIRRKNETSISERFTPIEIDKISKPRQGINTCGANNVFFFSSCIPADNNCVLLDGEYVLPQEYVFPFANRQKSADSPTPKKWVLIPYSKDGKVLNQKQVVDTPLLADYLSLHEVKLKNRKGVLIRSQIDKGIWWSLLGVGAYNFFEYKVIWDAYGSNHFAPRIVSQTEQADQSLQAYIPVRTKKEATRILNELKQPIISEYLHSMNMQGTMNWAQPGKLKKLLKFSV